MISRIYGFLLAIGFGLAISGCETFPAKSNAFAPAASGAGAILHRDSGFVFPARIGRFQRVMPHQYDAAGRDVSVGYNNFSPAVVATIYVYPTGGLTLEQEFSRRENEVKAGHVGVQRVARGETFITPRGVRALTAEYAFEGNFGGTTLPLRSVLLVAQDGERFVEYRFSYPAVLQVTAAALARQLAQTYAWPSR